MIATALLALTAGTCSSDDDPDDTSPTTERTTERTTTTLSPEAEVEAAYLAYRDMVTRLLQAPDPDDPELGERTTDPNRAFLVDRLRALVQQGQRLRFGPDYEYDVLAVSIDGDQATVRECTVDDAQTVAATSGEVLSEGVTTELLEATLRRNSGKWRVTTVDGIEHWEGAVTCEE
jgi:hypothetical protein